MKIVQALKEENVYGLRVVYGDRWLVYDKVLELFMIFEHKNRSKSSKFIFETKSEDIAVEKLLEECDQ